MHYLSALWMVVIFIGTCTRDVYAFLGSGEVNFNFTLNPDTANLFSFYSITDASEFELVGHFLMFFILIMLLLGVFRNLFMSIALALTYGVVIELIQPFFGRGADLYDLLADVAGVFTLVVMYWIYSKRTRFA